MPITRKIIFTPNAPAPVGPYSQAVVADNTVYVSGVIGINPQTKELVSGGTVEEFKQCLKNLDQILDKAGSQLEGVVKTSIFLNNIEDFPAINEVYKEYFCRNYPARSTFQVGKLPADANVEIEAIAMVGCVRTIPPSPSDSISSIEN